MKPEEQLLLKFEKFNISNVAFEVKDEYFVGEPKKLEIALKSDFEFYTDKEFFLILNLKLFDSLQSISIEVTVKAKFSSNQVFTEEFMQSNLVKINAPTLVFPYLRAFVSTLTANSGFTIPIILPTLNFASIGDTPAN